MLRFFGRILSCTLLLSGIALASQTLQLTTQDGTTLHAEYHAAASPRAAVVLLHQISGNTCEYGTFPETLADLGYATLAVDLRVGGNSFGCKNHSTSLVAPDVLDVPLDIEAAVSWLLETTHLQQVVLVGSSFSGGQVLMYAGNHPEQVQGVVAFSPASDSGLIVEVIQAAQRIQVPVLFVAPSNETGFPGQLLPVIPASQKALVVPAGSTHGAVGLVQSGTGPEYREILLGFLKNLTP